MNLNFLVPSIFLLFSIISVNAQDTIYVYNKDNIYEDIRMNANSLDLDFDLESNIIKKPLFLVVTLRNCDNCNSIINNILELYPKYTGVFYPVIVLANWEEVSYYKNKYGNQFIYIPLIITSMKNVTNIPYIVLTNRQGIIKAVYNRKLDKHEVEVLINSIVKE